MSADAEKLIRSCPACESRAAKQYGSKNNFELFGCRTCGSIYTDRVPSAFEEEDYDAYYSEANLTVPDFIQLRLNEIVSGFEPYRLNNRLLDIGFGAGTLLKTANEMGWSTTGTEVSSTAVQHAESQGFDAFLGNVSDAKFPDDQFDVITASEILEHLLEPNVELKEIVRILRPGGLLWATTPSARSISFRLMKLNWTVLSPPEHIQLYSKKGAFKLLKTAGFGKIRFKTYGLNPAELKNHFLKKESGNGEQFSRVGSAYQLNEALTKDPLRRFVKNVLNEGLNVFRIGDSLKIFAEKPK